MGIKFFITLFFMSTMTIINAQDFSDFNYDAQSDCWQINTYTTYSPQNNLSPDSINWHLVTTAYGSFTDIFFVDSSYGWTTNTSNGGARTTDGGFTWTPFAFNDTTLLTTYKGTYFLNKDTGWCVGGSAQIRKTTNGGISWFKQYAPVTGILNDIYFFNNNSGIAVGRKNATYNSYVIRTSDGGNNWYEVTVSTDNQNELNDQYWLDSNTGFLCGRNVLVKTTDGGNTWNNIFANILPISNGVNALLSIYFVNDQVGWIGASNVDHKNIYKTTDGGASWIFQDNPIAQTQYSQINDVKFLSADSGWAVFGIPFNGRILFTSDGGSNWTIQQSTNDFLTSISYYQRYKIWTAGDGDVWYSYLENVLPVELKSFTAKAEGNNVILIWKTATETNNKGFYIERSEDNSISSNWKTVSFITGNGTSSEPKSYSFTDKNLNSGSYEYRLKQVDFDGSYKYSNYVSANIHSNMNFSLKQNYPNPFNPSTIISFTLASNSKVTLQLFDLLGRRVSTLIDQHMNAGEHLVNFKASNLGSGIYLYKIEAKGDNGNDFISVKKMTLIK